MEKYNKEKYKKEKINKLKGNMASITKNSFCKEKKK
jgi:hypothetical protein